MTDPTEEIPPARALGQSDRDLESRAFRLGVTGATGVRAVVELADQLHRTSLGEEAAIPEGADVHHLATGREITV